MNCRKDIESVQKTVLLMTISSSSCIIRFSLTANAAAHNSNLGIVIVFKAPGQT